MEGSSQIERDRKYFLEEISKTLENETFFRIWANIALVFTTSDNDPKTFHNLGPDEREFIISLQGHSQIGITSQFFFDKIVPIIENTVVGNKKYTIGIKNF